MVGFTVVAVEWGFGQLARVMGLGGRLESDGIFSIGHMVVQLHGSNGLDDGVWGILCNLGCFRCWLTAGWQFIEVLASSFRTRYCG